MIWSSESTGGGPAISSVVASLAATYWVDSTKPALRRKFPRPCMGTMHPGEHGFAVAKFSAFEGRPAEEKQTEIPNLLLQVHFVSKKPATRVKKQPAAVLEADKPPASEAASMHSEESSGSGELKKLTMLNLHD